MKGRSKRKHKNNAYMVTFLSLFYYYIDDVYKDETKRDMMFTVIKTRKPSNFELLDACPLTCHSQIVCFRDVDENKVVAVFVDKITVP